MDVVDIDYRAYDRNQPRNFLDRDNPLEDYRDDIFEHRFRLNKDCFRDLLNLLNLERLTQRNNPLPPALQLATTLQFYATGCYQYVLGDLQGLSQPSVSRIILQTSKEIARLARTHIVFPQNIQEKLRINRDFRNKVRIPSIIGAIDCTHIRIKAPVDNAAVFVNRKGYYSLNVQVICTSDYKIMNVVARHPGSAHDSRIFENSSVKERLQTGDLHGSLLIGDEGYACTNVLLTPVRFPQTASETAYNFHFIRARGCVERAFGVLKSRFAVLGPDSRIRLKHTTVPIITVACVVLHNMCLQRGIVIIDGDIPVNYENFNQPNPRRNERGSALRNRLIQRFFAVPV